MKEISVKRKVLVGMGLVVSLISLLVTMVSADDQAELAKVGN